MTGQVAKHFTHMDDAYRDVLAPELWNSSNYGWAIVQQFTLLGLDVATQNYTYTIDGLRVMGQNLHGIMRAPRAEGTEALVLSAPWRCHNGSPNRYGIQLMLNMAKYFKSKPYWSMDIVFVVTGDGKVGMNSWLNAYHGFDYNPYDGKIIASASKLRITIKVCGILSYPVTQAPYAPPSIWSSRAKVLTPGLVSFHMGSMAGFQMPTLLLLS